MRVVVLGATGNVGTSVLEALGRDPGVEEIVGVARRKPRHVFPRTRFVAADVTRDDLLPIFRGADAVVHLAWLIQPSRDRALMRSVNVDGSQRVLRAIVEAGVPALVYASSVGAYSPGPKDRTVDEAWPTGGIPTSFYSRHKVAVERMLDRLESERPRLRVARMRPGLIFKAQAATEIRRLFIGQVPPVLVQRRFVPVVPDMPRLRFQVVHSHDVGDAFARAVVSADASGAFNLAAEPPIGPGQLAEVFSARPVRVPRSLARAAVFAAYRLHLSPADEGWLDMALGVPLLDCGRARRELGWEPRHESLATLAELIDGIGRAADLDTPPLSTAGSLRRLRTR